jgi:hypothetical protein
MQGSPPPKPAILLSLAALAIEVPFFVTCLLVQLLKNCSHCRHEWLSWPILAGAFPSYFAAINLHMAPAHLSLNMFKFGSGAFTASLIALVFLLGLKTTLWRQLLAGALLVSTGLAVLAFLLIAA